MLPHGINQRLICLVLTSLFLVVVVVVVVGGVGVGVGVVVVVVVVVVDTVWYVHVEDTVCFFSIEPIASLKRYT